MAMNNSGKDAISDPLEAQNSDSDEIMKMIKDGTFLQRTEEVPESEFKIQPKERISFRADKEVADYYKGYGVGWSTRINQILVEHMMKEKQEELERLQARYAKSAELANQK